MLGDGALRRRQPGGSGCCERSWSRRGRATRRPSAPWFVRSATAASSSPIGSCATPTSPRTRSRWPSSRCGGSFPRLRDLDRFEAWLHRILVNACYAEARRGRRFAADVVLLETDAPAAGDEFLTVHDRDQLDRGFRRLPPEQRAVLVFHYALGLTVPEVADHLGIPLGTAKSRLSYATAAIRAALEADARTPVLDQEQLA